MIDSFFSFSSSLYSSFGTFLPFSLALSLRKVWKSDSSRSRLMATISLSSFWLMHLALAEAFFMVNLSCEAILRSFRLLLAKLIEPMKLFIVFLSFLRACSLDQRKQDICCSLWRCILCLASYWKVYSSILPSCSRYWLSVLILCPWQTSSCSLAERCTTLGASLSPPLGLPFPPVTST